MQIINTLQTVIYVTHHPEEILPLFNKDVLMKKGGIHSQGNLQDIFSGANLSDFFWCKNLGIVEQKTFLH